MKTHGRCILDTRAWPSCKRFNQEFPDMSEPKISEKRGFQLMTPREILRSAEPQARKLYHFLLEGRPPNLNGDRAVEYSWIAARMPDGPGKALDFGCGTWSWMTLLAARKGFEAVGLD